MVGGGYFVDPLSRLRVGTANVNSPNAARRRDEVSGTTTTAARFMLPVRAKNIGNGWFPFTKNGRSTPRF